MRKRGRMISGRDCDDSMKEGEGVFEKIARREGKGESVGTDSWKGRDC